MNALPAPELLKSVGNVSGLVLSVAGLIYSAIQVRHAREQQELAHRTAGMTDVIAKSLSTRFVSDFPNYLPKVAGLIQDAKYSLRIMAIVPSHGEYSDPHAWFSIREAIVAKMHECAKNSAFDQNFERVLLYSSKNCALDAFKLHHRELSPENEWEQWKKVETDSGILTTFLATHQDLASDILPDLSNLALERYLNIRIDADRKSINEVYKGFHLKESDERLPMFCWIADSKMESQRAVFSIRTEDARGHYKGAAVVTSDPGLVATLVSMFDYYSRLPTTTDKTPAAIFRRLPRE